MWHAAIGPDFGTPPLAQGPQAHQRPDLVHPRNTPARAGTTWAGQPGAAGRSEHPRSRRDHEAPGNEPPHPAGTPPLAQGPLVLPHVGSGDDRNTPARAGTTRPGPGRRHRWAEHPRSRRDHAPGQSGNATAGGTPPLAQGPRAPAGPTGPHRRNTPARAGTTPPRAVRHRRPPEHPRSRGDPSGTSPTPPPDAGTPPLARGPRQRMTSKQIMHRNTPARAGTPAGPVEK